MPEGDAVAGKLIDNPLIFLCELISENFDMNRKLIFSALAVCLVALFGCEQKITAQTELAEKKESSGKDAALINEKPIAPFGTKRGGL